MRRWRWITGLNKMARIWCWHHQRAIVFTRAEDGTARLILNLIEDITERKHNEETLLRFSNRAEDDH